MKEEKKFQTNFDPKNFQLDLYCVRCILTLLLLKYQYKCRMDMIIDYTDLVQIYNLTEGIMYVRRDQLFKKPGEYSVSLENYTEIVYEIFKVFNLGFFDKIFINRMRSSSPKLLRSLNVPPKSFLAETDVYKRWMTDVNLIQLSLLDKENPSDEGSTYNKTLSLIIVIILWYYSPNFSKPIQKIFLDRENPLSRALRLVFGRSQQQYFYKLKDSKDIEKLFLTFQRFYDDRMYNFFLSKIKENKKPIYEVRKGVFVIPIPAKTPEVEAKRQFEKFKKENKHIFTLKVFSHIFLLLIDPFNDFHCSIIFGNTPNTRSVLLFHNITDIPDTPKMPDITDTP